jgi:hypothetical protein
MPSLVLLIGVMPWCGLRRDRGGPGRNGLVVGVGVRVDHGLGPRGSPAARRVDRFDLASVLRGEGVAIVVAAHDQREEDVLRDLVEVAGYLRDAFLAPQALCVAGEQPLAVVLGFGCCS